MRSAVENAGASYWNASTWIPDPDLFADNLHLAKEGAAEFSKLLARKLVEQQR
jgi:hypothetical protein